ncbi:beta-lactamase family protein [Aquimarina sp. ERC-38]|uniref:serine hydrolase domain-containing protein n=1 Tax=Aquimarina sp. ERC-38 TaxID=2949996 RepID=UPI0022476AD8|nr:serine hydrolase domain-containing protein [Aquimarina sp. ERC-38]UZO79955.1 beta-lactamase family protein [Aquimarina sp. ERC-38]
MKIKWIVYSLILIVAQSCNSQSNKKELSIIVENEVEKVLKDHRFNAISIAVVDKKRSFLGHYGELDKHLNNKPSNKTLYEIASVSKTMTGYLVACAVNEQKLKLESSVYDILGKEYENLEFNGEPVRIKHLITHTSGLPLNIKGISELYQKATTNNYYKAKKKLNEYKKEELLSEVKYLELHQKPGEVYSYSNVAPNLIAYILEKVYDKSFEQILKEKLLIPAQMTNTYINLDKNNELLLANGYNDRNELMPNFKKPIKLWGAAGRIKSNSKDLLNYIKWQLNSENSNVKISHTKLFHDVDNIWIGYFWEIIQDENSSHLEHHGGIYGSQNWLMIYPEQNIGISIIANSSFPEANQIIKELANSILNRLK